MNFDKTPLNEFVTLQRGFDLPKDDRIEGNVPVVASTGIGGYHHEAKASAPGVVIGRSGSIGGGQYIEQDFWPLNTTLWVKDFKGHDPRYVYYLMRSIDFSTFNVGSGVPTLNRNHLSSLLVNEQGHESEKRIAKHLGDIDDKIAVNTKTNQTLEEMAQTIFKSWFVDFDPVKAKMNGEQPEGMDAATASLFPDKLVESELGLIPEGWEASCMGEHFNITMGQSPKGETYNEDGKGIAFFQGRRDFGFRYPDVRVFTTDPKRYAKAGDTLISVRAPVGDKNMAAIDCCIGRGVAAIKHKSQSRSFTYAFVSHIEKKLGDSGSSGTVFSSINQNELKKVSFVAPPQELIEAFHKLVDPIDQKIEVLSEEIKSLSALRDTLLPKLLSGEIELDVAEVNTNE
ncbi:restriction endonuclease subunit S [Vibrio cholerae]|nr:restriction endonuclease subunit S [Vibrio cholerae]EGR4173708.1 restriction endonuclease subunit S [Vibrio cholerae]